MVSMDAFASAFGFDAKSDDVWTTLGKVTAVNGGTLSVLLGGSATPTECEAYCLASVGDIVFVAITKGRARAIACKGVDAATWRTALGLGSMATEDSSDYLPVSGGTLTGEPTVLQQNASIKRSTADSTLSDNGVSANSYLYYRFLDKNDLFTGWFGNIIKTDGMVQTQLAARKKVNGSNIDNVLYLDVDASGNRIVAMTDPDVWLDALGVGAVESDSTSTAQSLPSGTGKSIASVSLAKGNWLVMGHTNMASNATGIRSLGIGTTDGTFTNSDMSTVTMSATNGSETRINTMSFVQPSATTTYYLNAYQNSGGSLDAKTAVMVAVRLG